MIILINGTNLNRGGGAQVADSICASLNSFCQHRFVVVLSFMLKNTAEKIKDYSNVVLYYYDYPSGDWLSLFSGRNRFLDRIVESEHVDMVFTIFGPCKWKPRVPHMAGFALSHLVIPESPFFQRMTVSQRLRWWMKIELWKYVFNKADYLYTENSIISQRVQKLYPDKRIFTVTNYYNQIFDQLDKQRYHELPSFDGWQFLNVGSSAPHKNLSIAIEVARILKNCYWDEIRRSSKPNFRFLFTIKESDFATIPEALSEHFFFIGTVDISEVPSLYSQADFLFQPSLLECFTAVYPEAMRMRKPIITTDLEFARGLCGGAALYFSATDPYSAAGAIASLIARPDLRCQLIQKGVAELAKFDDYNARSMKLINLCELIGCRQV